MSTRSRVAWRAKLPRSTTQLADWLLDRGSLTARLQAHGKFALTLRRQGLARPTRDEASALGYRRNRLLQLREISLHVDRVALVFAHSVLPCQPRGPLNRWLARLNNRSLGALLFAHPGFKRGPITCRRIDRRHALFQPAIDAFQLIDLNPRYLWARRSFFTFGRQSLLVTEVFSPVLGDD